MAHWCDTYPHEIFASVILKDNKIYHWKVGQYKLSEKYDIQSLIQKHPNYSYNEKCFVVNNDSEHNEVFEKLSTEWFGQWEFNEESPGGSPFTQSFIAGDIIGGRYEVIKPMKTGD